MTFRPFSALPTWALNRLLPAEHPFRAMSLSDWHRGQTQLCRQFDALLWVNAAALAAIGSSLLLGH